MKILVDTDIGYGTDADDALALAYLLKQPACELLGITTVGLHSPWRAAMAEAICRGLGRTQIPIAAGADRPLQANRYWRENPVRPWPGTGSLAARRSYEPNRAVALMRRVIRAHPGQLTLVTIGQFTNLAMLQATDPEAVRMLKDRVSMGGHLADPPNPPKSECNVMLDPAAAAAVFRAMAGNFTLVPINPARGVKLAAPELDRVFSDTRLEAVRYACRGWGETRGKNHVGMADPLTVASLFEPSLLSAERGTVRLRRARELRPGDAPAENGEVADVTVFEPDPAGPHRVSRKSRLEAAHAHVLEVLLDA